MNILKFAALIIAVGASALAASAESKYDVRQIYEVVNLDSGTKAVSRNGNVCEAEYLLVPSRLSTGTYEVKVKKIGDNLYRIVNSDICVETRYCHEWASFGEEVILIIDSNYGYNKGSIIFD